MDTNNDNDEIEGEKNCSGMKWTDIKQFQHRYVVDIPKHLERNLQLEVELPSPTFDPVKVANCNSYREVFKPKPKLDTRLVYFKRLYAKTNKKILKDMIKENDFGALPQYVVDVAQGGFEDNEDHPWCYTGGTLDCLFFDNNTYVARAGLHQTVQVIDLYEPGTNVCIDLNENGSVYNLKSVSYDDDALLAVRQKRRISLFHLSQNDDQLEASLLFKTKTIDSTFVDMAFNKFKRNEIAAINDKHNLKIKNFARNKTVRTYNFGPNSVGLSDNFAQIKYIDHNTVAFINRCCIYLLDLRSLNIQKSCLKTTWLKCDDLCTFSKSKQDPSCMYVSSTHNVIKLDMRSLKSVNRVLHMLSTPPLISSCMQYDRGEYISLSGQQMNDKVLLYSSLERFSMPLYIPNTRDTLTTANLTKTSNISQHLEERLSLPSLGMKLYKDKASADIILYTLNSVGDVFKQKLVQTKPDPTDAVNRLIDWSNVLPYTHLLQSTSLCNLANIRHTMSARFPEAKKLTAIMKESHSRQLFEKEYVGLTQYLEGTVGEAMNAIWDVQDIVAETDANAILEVSSKSKVSEWLDSTVGS